MIEKPKKWNKHKDTMDHDLIAVPPKAIWPATFKPEEMTRYTLEAQAHQLYHYLKEAGKEKILTWVDAGLFVDLHEDGDLPANYTPRDLLDHLSEM